MKIIIKTDQRDSNKKQTLGGNSEEKAGSAAALRGGATVQVSGDAVKWFLAPQSSVGNAGMFPMTTEQNISSGAENLCSILTATAATACQRRFCILSNTSSGSELTSSSGDKLVQLCVSSKFAGHSGSVWRQRKTRRLNLPQNFPLDC